MGFNIIIIFRVETGEFETLDMTPFSAPPDLPDVMKSQDSNGQEQVFKHPRDLNSQNAI